MSVCNNVARFEPLVHVEFNHFLLIAELILIIPFLLVCVLQTVNSIIPHSRTQLPEILARYQGFLVNPSGKVAKRLLLWVTFNISSGTFELLHGNYKGLIGARIIVI